MSRTTLANAKASRIPSVLGLCAGDARFLAILNEAQQRLLMRGKYWGTFARYRFCVTDGCITWPRQIAAIEAISACCAPVPIRNEWFEFLENGPGVQDTESCGRQLMDRGTACAFNDIAGANKKIRVYSDVAEAASAKILLLGYDENSNWIRTLVSGQYVDGEYVSISTTPTNSVNTFSVLTAVQKPITNGTVRLYEYDSVLLTQRALAIYESDETNPSYRRSLITGMGDIPSGETRKVEVMAKHDFIPARVDTDYLVIGNLAALKEMCVSIAKMEQNLIAESEAYEARAIRELDKELAHYQGAGAIVTIRTPHASIWGGAVDNLAGYGYGYASY